MSHPRFSIVIPARERACTLTATLRSCLAVEHDDFEVVVFDNASSPTVRGVADALAEPRLRYFRSDNLLAMTDSWNTAVGHARGEWIIVIGNDDAVLPHCLHQIDAIVAEHAVKAVKWATATYTWPDLGDPRDANVLSLPLSRELNLLDGVECVRLVAKTGIDINALPGNYHGAVHREVLDEVRRRTGQVYASGYPDTYSCVAFAIVAGKFAHSSSALSVYGLSSFSGNVAARLHQFQTPTGREFKQLNSQSGLTTHPWFPEFGVGHTVVPDAFLQAKEKLFPNDDSLVLDRRAWTEFLVRTLWMPNEADRRRLIAVVRDHLTDDPEMLSWFDREKISELPSNGELRLRQPFWGFDGEHMWLDAARFGVTDVFEASKLCLTLTGGQEPLMWNVPTRLTERRRLNYRCELLEEECRVLRETLETGMSCLPFRLVRDFRGWLHGDARQKTA